MKRRNNNSNKNKDKQISNMVDLSSESNIKGLKNLNYKAEIIRMNRKVKVNDKLSTKYAF